MCLFGSSCVRGVGEATGGGRDSRVDALFSVLQALTARLGYEQGVGEEGVPSRRGGCVVGIRGFLSPGARV